MSNTKLVTDSSRLNEATKDIKKYINDILDKNSFVEVGAFISGSTFLDGVDAEGEGVITGYGTISGKPLYLFAQNSAVFKGSISNAHSEKIIKCMNMAINNGLPFLSIIDSAGVRIGEGISAMEGYSSLINKAIELSGETLHIAIAKGNCVGVMSAFASLADYFISTEEGVISLNAPTVVTAKALKSGKLSEMLGYNNHKSNLIKFNCKKVKNIKETVTYILKTTDKVDVKINDNPNRTELKLNNNSSVRDIIKAFSDGGLFTELTENYAKEIICAFSTVNGIRVAILANDSEINEYTTVDGMKKSTNFLNIVDSFNIPLITLVNSKGIQTSYEDEINGASVIAGDLLYAITTASVPKLSVIVGNCVGLAYTAFASKSVGYDYAIAFDEAYIAPITMDAAANFYESELRSAVDPIKTRAELEKKYQKENSAFIAAKEGAVDNIIEPKNIRPYLASTLLMLLGL